MAETMEVQMVVQRAASLAQNCLAQKKVDCWVEKTVVQMDEMTAVSSAQKMAVQMAAMMAVQITKSKRSMVRTRTSN